MTIRLIDTAEEHAKRHRLTEVFRTITFKDRRQYRRRTRELSEAMRGTTQRNLWRILRRGDHYLVNELSRNRAITPEMQKEILQFAIKRRTTAPLRALTTNPSLDVEIGKEILTYAISMRDTDIITNLTMHSGTTSGMLAYIVNFCTEEGPLMSAKRLYPLLNDVVSNANTPDGAMRQLIDAMVNHEIPAYYDVLRRTLNRAGLSYAILEHVFDNIDKLGELASTQMGIYGDAKGDPDKVKVELLSLMMNHDNAPWTLRDRITEAYNISSSDAMGAPSKILGAPDVPKALKKADRGQGLPPMDPIG